MTDSADLRPQEAGANPAESSHYDPADAIPKASAVDGEIKDSAPCHPLPSTLPDPSQQAPPPLPGPDDQHSAAGDNDEPAETTAPAALVVIANPTESNAQPAAPEEVSVVRFGFLKQIGLFRHSLDSPPRRGAKVVIRTERGVELGEVVVSIAEPSATPGRHDCITCKRLGEYCAGQPQEAVPTHQGKILRLATSQDLNDQDHLDLSGSEKLIYGRQQIVQLRLPMKLVAVENLLGGERVIFYFTSEHRVDFRDLVRHLAGQYRTRIEMRQVGARDEARLVGDYERCGQRCCCQQFLKSLQPVSIRMAKTQKATLDPSKISGRCGRLMCCLRFEDEGYEQLRKRLPRKNTFVRTDEMVGRVIDTQILTQLVKLILPDGKIVAVENDAIVERDVPPPPPVQFVPHVRSEPRRDNRRPLRQEPMPEPAAAEITDVADAAPEPQTIAAPSPEVPASPADAAAKKRRRRRRRKPAGSMSGQVGQADSTTPAGGSSPSQRKPVLADQQDPNRKKRRRRRRRPGSPGMPGDNGPAGPAT